MTTKVCTKCHQELPEKDFPGQRHADTGRYRMKRVLRERGVK